MSKWNEKIKKERKEKKRETKEPCIIETHLKLVSTGLAEVDLGLQCQTDRQKEKEEGRTRAEMNADCNRA
jgi:hypothetical protein